MKPSRYNFFYPYKPDSNKHIAYNSFSNALALMETRQYDEYRLIENMTKRILSLAEEYKFLYSASIVTNGYLLSPENARRMLDCKIASCQVTIDGEAETHNARRPHASGSDTYDVIIKNLQAVKDILPFIILRVNIDKEKTDAISHVIETLKELQLNNVNAYPAPILDTNGCYSAGACLSSSEFFRFEYDFIKASRDHNRMLQKYTAITQVLIRK